MPPERVEQVMALLRENPLRGGGKPPVVVAGSWHVKVGKRTRNRGSVLDGRGDLMFRFDKCLAYIIDRKSKGCSEDIEYGEIVPLLLTEDELIVFQICLDFCHVERQEILKRCNASLVIVPSMGGKDTFKAHVDSASRLQIVNETQTVVVQQNNGIVDTEIGYILLGHLKPLKTKKQFTLFHISDEHVA